MSLEPATVTEGQIRAEAERNPLDEKNVRRIFQVLHGFYGNLFTSKFQTGNVIAKGPNKGEDEGLANARRIWAHGLRKFDGATVRAALDQCQRAHPEYPPSMPQLLALCEANRRREPIPEAQAKIPMGAELNSHYARKARESNLANLSLARAAAIGDKRIDPGLSGLKQAIAGAVAAAGGSEAAELVRLDRMFAKETGDARQ